MADLLLDPEQERGIPPSALFAVESAQAMSDADLDGMRRLWARVLMQALAEYWLAPPSSVRFKEALEWIFHSDCAAKNSFGNVCALMGFNPTEVRAKAAALCSQFRQDPSRAEGFIREMQSNGFGGVK